MFAYTASSSILILSVLATLTASSALPQPFDHIVIRTPITRAEASNDIIIRSPGADAGADDIIIRSPAASAKNNIIIRSPEADAGANDIIIRSPEAAGADDIIIRSPEAHADADDINIREPEMVHVALAPTRKRSRVMRSALTHRQ